MKKMSIKEELVNIRNRLGLTQLQFARLFNKTTPRDLHTSRSDIAKYETGVVDPPATKYKKFVSLSVITKKE